jgi:hypothetical protein
MSAALVSFSDQTIVDPDDGTDEGVVADCEDADVVSYFPIDEEAGREAAQYLFAFLGLEKLGRLPGNVERGGRDALNDAETLGNFRRLVSVTQVHFLNFVALRILQSTIPIMHTV